MEPGALQLRHAVSLITPKQKRCVFFWWCQGLSPRPACRAGRFDPQDLPFTTTQVARLDRGSPAEQPWLCRMGIDSGSEATPASSLTPAGGWYTRSKVLRLCLGKGWKDTSNHCEARCSSIRSIPSSQICLTQPKVTNIALLLL